MQNSRQKYVLFVDGSNIGRITKLSFVTSVSITVDDLHPLVVELFFDYLHFVSNLRGVKGSDVSYRCFLVYYADVK